MTNELEAHAVIGFEVVDPLHTDAIALYSNAGYHQIERYNDNPYPDYFFEKQLSG